MRKVVLPVLALFIVCVVVLSAQQAPETMRINADNVNLRTAASIDSTIVRALAKGTLVTVLGRDGSWIRVQLQGQTTTGWVRGNLLTAMSGGTAAAAASGGSVASTAPTTTRPTQGAVPPAAAVPPPAATSPPSVKRAPGVQVEVYGGLSRVQTRASNGSATSSSDWDNGFAGELGVILPVGASIGAELVAGYTQAHATFADGAGDTYSATDRLAVGGFYLRPGVSLSAAKVFLLGGPRVQYEFSCSTSVSGTFGTATSECNSSDYVRLDYGVVIGGGVQFGPLELAARYEVGLKNLAQTAGATVKSRYLFVGAGLVF